MVNIKQAKKENVCTIQKKKQKKPIKPIWLKRIIKGKDRKIKKDLKTPKYRMRVVEDKKKKADKLYCRTKTRRNKYNDQRQR